MSTPQEQAREILAALKPLVHGEAVPPPGDPPNLAAMHEGARAAAQHAYDEKVAKYADFVMSKPSGSLTVEERNFLSREIARWSREEGRR